MSQKRHFHLWLPSGRSLCDRHDFAEASKREPDEEVYTCGACCLAHEILSVQREYLVKGFGQPDSDPDGWVDTLGETRWAQTVDLDQVRDEVEDLRQVSNPVLEGQKS